MHSVKIQTTDVIVLRLRDTWNRSGAAGLEHVVLVALA